MKKRIADVDRLKMHAVSYSSILNIGDTNEANPISYQIAFQQEGAAFYSDQDLKFEDYPIFNMEPNWIQQERSVKIHSIHHCDTIKAENIHITGASQSSIVQIGSIRKINADARVKHFRRIRSEEE